MPEMTKDEIRNFLF